MSQTTTIIIQSMYIYSTYLLGRVVSPQPLISNFSSDCNVLKISSGRFSCGELDPETVSL